MLQQIPGERQHPARGFAPGRPFHNFAIVFKGVDVAEPYVFLRCGNQHNVRDVAGAKAAADRELNVLEETQSPPFGLEPLHGHGWLSSIGLSAAASEAYKDLADHQALCGNRMAGLDHFGGRPIEIIYQAGYTIQKELRRRLLAHILRDKKKMLNRVRRIRGQVESVEHAIEREADCSEILHTISACRGAINSLMAEVLDGHIRFHVMDPDHNPTSEKARATQELIDVIRAYLR